MRVLCVTSTFPRWQQDSTTSFILHLCQQLQQAGLEVDVLAPHAPGAALQEELEGVSVSRFRYWAAGGETLAYGGGALFNLQGSLTNKVKLPGFVAAQYAAVQQALARRSYDIVHAHWLLPQGWVASRLPGRTRTGVVATVHGSDVFGLQNPVLRTFKRSALRRADAVTVNSSATAAAVRDIAPHAPAPRLIPMGIDVDRRADEACVSAFRARFRRPGGPLLAFVGRLVDWKGVDDLIRALPLLQEKLPAATLCIAGDGNLRAELEHLAGELGLRDRVHFLGWQDPETVAALQHAADVNVVPSRTAADGSREAQGLTVVEAMLAGQPLVATDSGGVPDAVQSGVTGLLVPERAPHRIAAAVQTLIADPDRAAAMAARARASALSRYSWTGTAGAFVDLFEHVRRGRSASRFGQRPDGDGLSSRSGSPPAVDVRETESGARAVATGPDGPLRLPGPLQLPVVLPRGCV